MRLFNSVILTRAISPFSLVGFGMAAVAALPGENLSQEAPPAAQSAAQIAPTDSLIEACYVAATGVVYLIKAPGLTNTATITFLNTNNANVNAAGTMTFKYMVIRP